MGAPPMVEGITIEAKSQDKATRNDAIQVRLFSERKRILAAIK
jgi:hypothetical protein